MPQTLAKRHRHPDMPSTRDELNARIADGLADLAGLYCGAVAESDHDLRQLLANLSDHDLARVARHLDAVVEAIV